MKKMMAVLMTLVMSITMVLSAWAGELNDQADALNDTSSQKPYVYFSDWKFEDTPDSTDVYTRDITVSDNGNYLMTYLDISGDRYYYYYDVIWQGKGEQKVYSHDWDSEEIRIGKLFRYETMDQCDMDIDQIISDHISIQASDGSSFILIFRPNGGEYDGTVQTITVFNGRRDLTADSYKDTSSVELLGVFRFPEEDRSALHFGDNIIQPDYTGFRIQMSLYSDVNDGIALMVYTDASENEVCVAQPILDGYGVLTTYDSADTVDEIKVGHFGIAGYCHGVTEALFEGIDFEGTPETENPNPAGMNQTESNPTDLNPTDPNPTDSNPTDSNPTDSNPTDSNPTDSNPTDPNPTDPDSITDRINSFLTGGSSGAPGTIQETEPTATAEHRIILNDSEEVVTDCPTSAKAGELVTIHTVGVTDAEVKIEVSGTDTGEWQDWGTYTFIMPDEDVEVRGWISTAGFTGA